MLNFKKLCEQAAEHNFIIYDPSAPPGKITFDLIKNMSGVMMREMLGKLTDIYVPTEIYQQIRNDIYPWDNILSVRIHVLDFLSKNSKFMEYMQKSFAIRPVLDGNDQYIILGIATNNDSYKMNAVFGSC